MHTHTFADNYKGFIGFGFNRKTDENTIIYYLQKFSDDKLMEKIIGNLSDNELEEIFNLITRLIKKNLSESEYHSLFLKDKNQNE